MSGRDFEKVRKRLKNKQKLVDETVAFLDNIRVIMSIVNSAEPEEMTTDTTTGAGLSFVEVTIDARFENADDAPTDIIDDHNWDRASLSNADNGYQLYLKDRKDLRA